jgi:hypothetical protein
MQRSPFEAVFVERKRGGTKEREEKRREEKRKEEYKQIVMGKHEKRRRARTWTRACDWPGTLKVGSRGGDCRYWLQRERSSPLCRSRESAPSFFILTHFVPFLLFIFVSIFI